MCRFRHITGSKVFIALGIRPPNLFSVTKLLHDLFFYIELKITSVAVALPLTVLLSHLLELPVFLLMWL